MSHAWSILSVNVVRFVLKVARFVLNVVRFVLAVVRYDRGPFCPWSVMSLIRIELPKSTNFQIHGSGSND